MNYIDRYIFTFVLFAFIGYVSEVIYCSIGDKKLVNRGFLYGPWLPIYGFGGLIIEVCLVPLRAYPVLVFLLGVILTSSVEYLGSWMLEKFFSVKLWDYSRYRFHINGRVCLLNSTLFGIMGLALVYGLEPYMAKLFSFIPDWLCEPLSIVLSILFTLDLTLSIIKMKAFKDAMLAAKAKALELEKQGRELSKELRERLEDEILEQQEKNRARFNRIISAFPSLTSRTDGLKKEIKAVQSWALARKLLKDEFKGEMKEMIAVYKARQKEIDEKLKRKDGR